jgi:hypothetical protein
MNKFITLLCLLTLLFGSTSRTMDSKSAKLNYKLIEAAGYGRLLKVKMLLVLGASVDACDKDGFTSLMAAAYCGHEAVCRKLIEKKATVDARRHDGQTPLALAANGHEAVCRLLIEKRANVDNRAKMGWTPLISASYHGLETICRLLVRRNATIDLLDNQGLCALSYAVSNGHEAVSKFLIDAQLRRFKTAAFVFLGIVRKRKQNLPCAMQYDVAKIIAGRISSAGVGQKEKESVITQIQAAYYSRIKYQLLEYVEQQMKTLGTRPARAPQINKDLALAAAPINAQPILAGNAATHSTGNFVPGVWYTRADLVCRDREMSPEAEVINLLMRVIFLILFYSIAS